MEDLSKRRVEHQNSSEQALKRYYKFCQSYRIPEDVQLGNMQAVKRYILISTDDCVTVLQNIETKLKE